MSRCEARILKNVLLHLESNRKSFIPTALAGSGSKTSPLLLSFHPTCLHPGTGLTSCDTPGPKTSSLDCTGVHPEPVWLCSYSRGFSPERNLAMLCGSRPSPALLHASPAYLLDSGAGTSSGDAPRCHSRDGGGYVESRLFLLETKGERQQQIPRACRPVPLQSPSREEIEESQGARRMPG